MAIDPTGEYAKIELERIRWFLGNIDLTIVERAGVHIQDAYNSLTSAAIEFERARKKP